ncbi:DNA repair exonuclease rad1 [Pseudozyma hubeiensis SY62]|uniref:DNA repair exonuclease rad1 n=1 Tax=Pseudozyma hubeiensis (strain SY62) TaxID=1305764 RepID=R9PCP9_PSEHS|nr:DNA repair exonuclease rad1 [Pseudozyma hubeiensis SY62]GAC99178.1 DNA repair exonuclease rad1 [Pseudozyma hubeiensis SY62]
MPIEVSSDAASAASLTATLSDVTGLANLLKSVAIQTHAVVIASSSGLEIITELNRTLQAHAYLYSHMFDSYSFQKPRIGNPASTPSNNPSRPRKRLKKVSEQEGSAADNTSSATSSDPESSQPEATRNDSHTRPRSHANGSDRSQDEPDSVSFEVNLQTWISCLNIFGGVGPSRPHSSSTAYAGSRPDHTGGGAQSTGRAYPRTRDGTVDPYGADRGTSVERVLDRNAFSPTAKATRMRLTYQGHGHPLVLELEQETNVLTRVSISTYEPSFLTDMVFDPHNMVSQIIVGSDLMQSAFAEIDATCKKLSILIASPDFEPSRDRHHRIETSTGASGKPSTSMLRFRAISDTGSSEMEFPASISSTDPTGVIEKFVALPGSDEQWYDFTLLSRTMTVLRSSIKTSLRMDEAGLISFQFMMPKYRRTVASGAALGSAAAQAAHDEEQDAFCEFLVSIHFDSPESTSFRSAEFRGFASRTPSTDFASRPRFSILLFL